jgi:hypothetical protein
MLGTSTCSPNLEENQLPSRSQYFLFFHLLQQINWLESGSWSPLSAPNRGRGWLWEADNVPHFGDTKDL